MSSNYEALLRAGWSPSSIEAMSMSISADLTDIDSKNDANMCGSNTPTKRRDSSTSHEMITPNDNKENYVLQNLDSRLQQAGWSPSSLLCALDSPPPCAPASSSSSSCLPAPSALGQYCDKGAGALSERSWVKAQPPAQSRRRARHSEETPLAGEQPWTPCPREKKVMALRETPSPCPDIVWRGTQRALRAQVPAPAPAPACRGERDTSGLADIFVLDLTADSPSPPPRAHRPIATTSSTSTKNASDGVARQLSRSITAVSSHGTPRGSLAGKAAAPRTVVCPATSHAGLSDRHLDKINSVAKIGTAVNNTCTAGVDNRSTGSHQADAALQCLLDEPLPNGWSLFGYQKECVRQCLRDQRVILALDMGLGKTIISVVWARAMCQRYPPGCCVVVVVAPCTLLETWRREGEMMGFTCVSNAATSGSSFEFSRHDLLRQSSTTGACAGAGAGAATGTSAPPLLLQASWAKTPSPSEVCDAVVRYNQLRGTRCAAGCGTKFVLVCDEAHAMQSLTSQRTQATLRLCQHQACVGTVLATGTPMKNGRPVNLLPLLAGIRHPLASNKMTFEMRYCNARKTKFCPWDTSGASNLVELQEKLGGKLIRKTKEECLDLPPLVRRRVVMPVPAHVQAAYQGVLQKFKAQSQQERRRGQGQEGSSGLEMVSALRQLTSTAKVDFTRDVIRRMLKSDRAAPIVVFVWYRDTARLLAEALQQPEGEGEKEGSLLDENGAVEEEVGAGRVEHLRCAVITGDVTKQSARQAIVDSFQAGQLDVVICSYGVGATGLTLTRSHTIILLDRPWTPGDARQAEDRVRRIGQKAASISSLWVAGFSLDESLDAMLQKKDKNCETVISADPHQAPQEWFQAGKKAVAEASAAAPGLQDTTSRAASGPLDSYFKSVASLSSIKRGGASGVPRASTATQAGAQAGAQAHPGTLEPSFVWSSTDREEVQDEQRGPGTGTGEGADLLEGAGASSVMKTLLTALLV